MSGKDCRKTVWKIVITGGPCAGKTTGLSWIQNTFEKMGYILLFIQEPATEMMSSGITVSRCSSPMAYQEFQMKLQYEKEKVYERAARDIADAHGEKVLIVCDRGFLDNRAYMTDEEYRTVLRELGASEKDIIESYDGVFHLETTAKNASIYYGTVNNSVRSETPEQAAELDDRVIAAWSRHPRLRIIENLGGFEDKMRHLTAEIAACLGEPVPPEIRRRYLIDYPDMEKLESIEDCHRIEIEQVYMRSAEDVEIRVRRQKSGRDCTFYMTRQKVSDGKRRLESETRLSEKVYLKLLEEADPARGRILKTRYSLIWKGQDFAIDLYPFWKDRALVEVSLSSEKQTIHFPPFLKHRKEVTGDERYEVSFLARTVTQHLKPAFSIGGQ